MEWKSWLNNIIFWIGFFFLIRLFGITNPPLEVGHNWRQTTVTMAARNFLEVDNNILYPRIDIAGEKTGITGMEFPVLNYTIYAVSKAFGYQHWYGRLINLIVTSFGLWFFFALCRKYFDKKIAFYATIILMCSIWFQFARKIMPDTFAMSFMIAAIYYGSNYLEKGKLKHLLFSAALACVGILAKLPAGYILIIFALWIFNSEIKWSRKILFAISSVLIIIPAAWWYFVWFPYLTQTYKFEHFFMGKDFGQAATEIFQNWDITLSRFYDTALKFIGFGVFIIGLVFAILKREKRIILSLLLCTLGFAVIVFKAGFTFYHHNYYVIPFVPMMALVAAYGLHKLQKPKLALFLLAAIVIENIANQQHDFFIKPKEKALIALDKDLTQVGVENNDLILINSDQYPTPMYFAHRKGWVDNNEAIQQKGYLDSLQKLGLKYVVVLKKSFGSKMELPSLKKVYQCEDYDIYSAYE